MIILALEASTSSVKALLYDGGIIDEHTIAYDEMVGDMRHQNVERIIFLLFACGKALLSAHDVDVDCIALSTVWSSLLLLDDDMKPKTLSTWADIGGNPKIGIYRQDSNLSQDAYERTGCNIHSKYPLWRYMAMDTKGDEHIGSLAEWLFYQFTGRWVVSDIMASGSGLYNLETHTWDHHLMNIAGIRLDQLPEIVSYKTLYPLGNHAASLLGTAPGIPVLIPSGDGCLNHISEMEDQNSVISLSIGTSAAIRVDVNHPLIVKDRSLWSHYLGDGRYVSGGTISGAGNLIQWFMDKLPERFSLDVLEAGVAQVDVANAPMFLPFIFGEQSPGWRLETYGGFIEQVDFKDLSDTRIYALYYGVLEGITMNLKQCLDRIKQADNHQRVIRVSGGVIHSKYWLQLLANMLNVPIHISEQQHQSMMGAIKVAKQALCQQFLDIESTVLHHQIVKTRAVSPQDHLSIYEERYERYKAAYASARP